MEQRERIAYIDVAKSICIVLMVVGHWTNNSTLLMYIYSFHMPALFVISGYLYKPHSWKRTVVSYGIPVMFYSLINICFLLIIGDLKVNTIISKDVFFRLFHYRYGLGDGFFMGDWFIWSLLGLRLFFGDVKIMPPFKRYYIYISIFVIVYMSFESYLVSIDTLFRGWYIGRLIPSLPFFCFGFYLKECKWKPQCLSLYIIIFLAFVFIYLPLVNGSCSINSNEYGLSYVVFFVNAIASTLFLFSISYVIPSTPFVKTISKGTLLILGLHIPMMKTLDFILPNYCDPLIPFMAVLLCYYPIKWFDKCCPILLGKSKKVTILG